MQCRQTARCSWISSAFSGGQLVRLVGGQLFRAGMVLGIFPAAALLGQEGEILSRSWVSSLTYRSPLPRLAQFSVSRLRA